MPIFDPFKFFLYNKNLTFLDFSILRSFKVAAKNKVAFSENSTHNSGHWFRNLMPNQLCQSVMPYQAQADGPLRPCSMESRKDPSPKSEVVHEAKFNLRISYSAHLNSVVGYIRSVL